MATIDDVKAAYLAINRTAISDAQAQAFATAIDGGSLTLDQFISQQIQTTSGKITQAEVATYAFLTGNTPSSVQLDALAKFGADQAAFYSSKGYVTALAPFEALGAAIASDATTKAAFAAKYGALSDKDFISSVYIATEGGVAPTFTGNPATGNGDHFLAQLAFYTNLYTKAGIPAADAALQARGAIAGQIISLPFTDATAAARSTLDDQTVNFLSSAAKGNTAGYGQPLPPAPPVGTTFTLSVNADGPGAVAPAVNTTGTDKNDIYNSVIDVASTLNSADNIDGKGGSDTLNVRIITSTAAVAPTLTAVETVAATAVGAVGQEINLASATGLTSVANVKSVTGSNVFFSNVVATAGASLTELASASTTTIGYAGAAGRTGTADAFNLTTNGSGAATGAAIFSLNGDATFEVANISATGKGSSLNMAIGGVDTIKTTGAATAQTATGFALSLTGSVLTNAKSIDATGLTAAGLSVDLGGAGNTKDVTFTGSGFNDSVKMGSGLTVADKLDGKAGTNTIGITNGGTLVSGLQVTNFQTLDIGGAFVSSTYEMSKLPGITTLEVSANLNLGVGAQIETINDLAKGAGILISAALGFPGDGDGVVVNVKDAGAGSPNDSIAVTLSSPTAFTTFGSLTTNDIETVTINSTSTGTGVTHTLTSFIDSVASTININASTAALNISSIADAGLVLLDASASVKAVNITTQANAFTANGGVAFTLGAAADTLNLVGSMFAVPTKAAIVTGNGGGDTIGLEAAGYNDTIVLKVATDSQVGLTADAVPLNKFDTVLGFIVAGGEDKIDLKAFGFTGTQAGTLDKVPVTPVTATGGVAAGDATNFFVNAGTKFGVAEVDSGGNTWVYVDVEKDGNFSATADAAILVTAVSAAILTNANYVFV